MRPSKAKGAANPGLVLALVCGVQFMVILDLAVVNIALPSIQTALRLSSSGLRWIVISYGLTFGGFLLLGGRLADLLGRRRVLVAGLVVLVVGSLSAGLARSFALLVLSRGLQGIGAALAAPAALSILTNTFAGGADFCEYRSDPSASRCKRGGLNLGICPAQLPDGP
jgi:MFS family permease